VIIRKSHFLKSPSYLCAKDSSMSLGTSSSDRLHPTALDWRGTCNRRVMAKQTSLERNWCSELVSLISTNRSGMSESMPGNLEEIGQASALVLTECAIPTGTRVHIACRAHVLRGNTKTCEYDSALGYFVEIELAPASRWSRRWFAPQHLMPLQELQLRRSA
jgi:hypothetical protein